MRDLQLVGLSEDGDSLVLSLDDGEQVRLPVDDQLLAAIRGDLVRIGQMNGETDTGRRPAEIQARIRAGDSAEQVAMITGLPVEKVRRYEGPVLAEREYVAGQARRTPVRRRGDGPTPTLGELVEERLVAAGVPLESMSWDSFRREDGTWQVTVRYVLGAAGGTSAAWVFDPRRRTVGPADEHSRRLTADLPKPAAVPAARGSAERRAAEGGPARRLASVPDPGDAGALAADDIEAIAEAVAGDRRGEPTRALGGAPERPGAAAAGRTDDALPLAGDDALPLAGQEHDAGAEQSGAGQRRPDGSPAGGVPAVTSQPESAAVGATETAEGAQTAEQAESDASASPRRPLPRHGGKARRASVPAWDDIVFGARHQD